MTEEDEFVKRVEEDEAEWDLQQAARDRQIEHGGSEALDSLDKEIELAEFATQRARQAYRDLGA